MALANERLCEFAQCTSIGKFGEVVVVDSHFRLLEVELA